MGSEMCIRDRDCDIVTEVSKCGSRVLDLIFPVLYLSNNFTAVLKQVRTSASRGIFFRFFGFVQETSLPYDM